LNELMLLLSGFLVSDERVKEGGCLNRGDGCPPLVWPLRCRTRGRGQQGPPSPPPLSLPASPYPAICNMFSTSQACPFFGVHTLFLSVGLTTRTHLMELKWSHLAGQAASRVQSPFFNLLFLFSSFFFSVFFFFFALVN
jgi:hypothetical protein